MKTTQLNLLDQKKSTLDESIRLSIDSLNHYGSLYKIWVVGYSGGKDSSATVSFIDWAINEGLVNPPKRKIVINTDTEMELPPLDVAAKAMLDKLEANGWEVIRDKANLDNSFLF